MKPLSSKFDRFILREGKPKFYYEKDVKEAVKMLKEEYPCCMKKRKCQKRYATNLICQNCRIRWKIDKIMGEFE